MRARPVVFIQFFPVELSPSPPLKSSTPQGLRAELFVVQSGNMSCPAAFSFSDGSQNVHVALLYPAVTCPVPESPPLVHVHPRWLLHTNHVCHRSRTPTRNFVSLCLDCRPHARTPEKSVPRCVFPIFRRINLGSREEFRTCLHFARHLLA